MLGSDFLKISKNTMKLLLEINNAIYDVIKFVHIHPFQDGNGRIGRYLMLRQCIESNIDLIAIDDEYNKEYKQALYTAQKDNDIIPLIGILTKCQTRLDEKLSKYSNIIKELNNKVAADKENNS